MFSTLVHHHNLTFVTLAAIVCVVGSILTGLITMRIFRATARRRQVQMVQTALIGGATIWSTHFIAMLAYDPQMPHGYDLGRTVLSLGIAILGLYLAAKILTSRRSLVRCLFAGAFFGTTVSAMHFMGMTAYQVAGRLIWDFGNVAIAVALGMVLGAAAYHRFAFPVTRLCWLGGASLMVTAICAMHFSAMAAFDIRPDPTVIVPAQLLSDEVLGMLVLIVTTTILFIGFAAFSVQLSLEQEAAAQMRHAAMHDHLTGLPNRQCLLGMMEDEVSGPLTHDMATQTLLHISIDAFKRINVLYGNRVGDAVLIALAQRLSDFCGPGQIAARIGGDEFGLTCRSCPDAAAALALARQMMELLAQPVTAKSHRIYLTGAIGIAHSAETAIDSTAILHDAATAMHHAKALVEDRMLLYDPDMDRAELQRLEMIDAMKDALAQGHFFLVYQLQNDLASLAPVGCEVLLRWHHPKRGLIRPDEFIPLAEETGLITRIGRWVLYTACMEAAGWERPYNIAVNVAPRQLLEPGFVDDLVAVLSESGLPPDRLELEVTEASIITDEAMTLRVMHAVKALGVRIAMDDFGTGYSSLATLQAFPFDKIKIDRSFVQDIHRNPVRAAIVRATLLLGEALDAPVLAEGVETEEELAYLRALKCAAVQGFYFGKPMPREEFLALANAPVDLAS